MYAKELELAKSDRIFELEGILNIQLDIEMQTAIENLSNFEYLNDEKITQYFVSLSIYHNATATTNSICDDDGRPFPSSPLKGQCHEIFDFWFFQIFFKHLLRYLQL